MRMSKIIVKHNHIIINDYELGDNERLERNFSIWDPLRHTLDMRVLEYIEDRKQLIVPRGVDIPYLKGLFNTNAKVDYNHDPYDTVGPIQLKYRPRDDVQKEALAFMQGERGYKKNKGLSQLSINLNTGAGKTYCCVANSAISGERSIIITSSIDWLNQWKSAVLEYTDIMPRETYMLVGSASIHRLMDRDMDQYKFIMASHDTIRSYGERNGWDAVTELFKHMKVGLKYYDEAHLNFDNMAKIDAYTNTYKSFYVTATPERSDEKEDVIYDYYFKNVPAINLFDTEDDPRTHYVALRYNSRPGPQDISNCRNPYGFDRNGYSSYIVGQPNYYKILRIVIQMALKNGGKNIFYIATNKSIDITYEWMISEYPDLAHDIGVFNSTVDSSIKAQQLEKRIILSTTKSLGTAQDIKGLKMVVVLAEPFRSQVTARQTLGRTRDYNTFYVDVVDRGFGTINTYYNSKRELFNKYALSTSVVDINDKELEERSNNIIQERIPLLNSISFINNKFLINPIQIVNKDGLIDPIEFV